LTSDHLASPQPSISVVTPVRGWSKLVERSVSAALADPATSEVIVVLDAPDETKGSQSIADRLAFSDSRVRVVSASTDVVPRRGQAARNVGARAARGDVVVALDADVIAHPGTISGHARHHAGVRGLAVVGYMPVVQSRSSRFTRPLVRFYDMSYESECARFRKDPGVILERLWGGNVSVRRDDWLAAAEISRAGGGYHDDRSFGLALRRLGLRAIFDPALRADHWYRRSISQFVRDARDSAAGDHEITETYALPSVGTEPSFARLARWVSSYRGTWGVCVAAAGGLAVGASFAGFNRAELLAARALWRLGRERGAIDVERRRTPTASA
jgi:Glycosyltransferase like family 2